MEIMDLDQLGQYIHEEVQKKFKNRSMPTEKVSENFMFQTVRSILKKLDQQGKIPFIPEFQILNKTSMEDRFNENIPDFSRHINLIGLGKDTEYNEYGVMNIAIDGEDAQRFEDEVQKEAETTPEPQPEPQPEQSEASAPDIRDQEDQSSQKDIPDYLTVIEGGKSR